MAIFGVWEWRWSKQALCYVFLSKEGAGEFFILKSYGHICLRVFVFYTERIA